MNPQIRNSLLFLLFVFSVNISYANLSSCDSSTIDQDLDIYIPSADYKTANSTVNLWLSLDFKGLDSDGDFVWKYSSLGINNPTTCKASATIAPNLDIKILSAEFETSGVTHSLWLDIQFKGLDSDGDFIWKYVNLGIEGDADTTNDENKTYDLMDYFPLKVGNWKIVDEYENSVYNRQFKYEITEIKNINGFDYYGDAYIDLRDQQIEDINYIRFDNNFLHNAGEWDHEDGLITLNPPIQLPRKVKVGDTSTSESNVYGPDGIKIGKFSNKTEVTEHLETITLNNGNVFHDCLHYTYHDTFTSPEETEVEIGMEWHCKGIGWVKYYEPGDDEYTEELSSYNIAK